MGTPLWRFLINPYKRMKKLNLINQRSINLFKKSLKAGYSSFLKPLSVLFTINWRLYSPGDAIYTNLG